MFCSYHYGRQIQQGHERLGNDKNQLQLLLCMETGASIKAEMECGVGGEDPGPKE